MFQLARAVRQTLDYRTEDINGIPGLHFNTDDNAHAGNRIQCVPIPCSAACSRLEASVINRR